MKDLCCLLSLLHQLQELHVLLPSVSWKCLVTWTILSAVLPLKPQDSKGEPWLLTSQVKIQLQRCFVKTPHTSTVTQWLNFFTVSLSKMLSKTWSLVSTMVKGRIYLRLTFFTVDDLNNRIRPIILRNRFNISPFLPVPVNICFCVFNFSKKTKCYSNHDMHECVSSNTSLLWTVPTILATLLSVTQTSKVSPT